MGEKALWPTVAIVVTVCTVVTILLIRGVDIAALLAAFGLMASIAMNMMSLMLYGKFSKIEQNTNGNMAQQLDMIRDLVAHAKRSVPLENATKVEIKED